MPFYQRLPNAGFSVDCLETLEEIAQENRELFLQHEGVSYQYIPALNADPMHIHMMAQLILRQIEEQND